VLFRSYGISGIVTFDLSRRAEPGDLVELDLAPDASKSDLQQLVDPFAHGSFVPGCLDGVLDPEIARLLEQLARTTPQQQACRYRAVMGAAAAARSGELVSGDAGSYCKGPDGRVYLLVCDGDLGKVRTARRQNKSVRDAVSFYREVEPMRVISCNMDALRSDGSLYHVEKLPFVPAAPTQRVERCNEIFNIQVSGLKKRLATLGCNAVVGVSGGLDSTLALLVAVEAMRQLGRPASHVYGVTMPCFGTSDRTYQNACKLMEALGVSSKEISIRDAVSTHFRDIGHDPSLHNGTYENAQARERTQVLMDYASVVNGIVVGTGDLSELALGWCTYNGDQMSMYSVNASLPKTLLRWVLEALGEDPRFAPAQEVLKDILATPISPELLPPEATGGISQRTEDIVGPYALHDFFLYHMLRFGFRPEKIYALACRAFRGEFDGQTVKKWLKVFYSRFFTQQFKRNSMPDGVKVGSVSLNPRGDWRMPSDTCGRMWLQEAENL